MNSLKHEYRAVKFKQRLTLQLLKIPDRIWFVNIFYSKMSSSIYFIGIRITYVYAGKNFFRHIQYTRSNVG